VIQLAEKEIDEQTLLYERFNITFKDTPVEFRKASRETIGRIFA